MNNSTSGDFSEVWYSSSDGLSLYARDYFCENAKATIVCLHGLTRNSADFEELCELLSDQYRVIAVDQRGRGRSQYDPDPSHYSPVVYIQDLMTLFDHLSLTRAILIGTSLGGLMAMMLSSMEPDKVQAVVLNDIGPDVDPAGLQRIKSYVGKLKAVSTWDEAVVQLKSFNEKEFPRLTETQWVNFAHNIYNENEQGQIQLAYDPAISKLLNNPEATAVDLWPFFNAMSLIPTLLLRGELSDLLSPECVEKMQKSKPDLQVVEIPECGHSPFLNEPESIQAIQAFLEKLTIC